jgi:hypothetical protein
LKDLRRRRRRRIILRIEIHAPLSPLAHMTFRRRKQIMEGWHYILSATGSSSGGSAGLTEVWTGTEM